MIVPSTTRTTQQAAHQAGGGPLPTPPTSPPTSSAPTTAEPQDPPSARARRPSGGPGAQAPVLDPPANPPTAIRPATVPVPPLAGLDRAAATKALKRAGLVPGPVSELDSPERIGDVLSAEPAPGTVVDRGSKVSMKVSAGLPVPALTGLRRAAAEAALAAAGLKPGTVTRSCSEQPTGEVLATLPKAGGRVQGGTPVALTVSRNGVTVPEVVGRSREQARAALTAAGLSVRTREQLVDDESQAGTVLSQSLQPGTCAGPADQVTITVGELAQSGPDPEEPSDTPPAPTASG